MWLLLRTPLVTLLQQKPLLPSLQFCNDISDWVHIYNLESNSHHNSCFSSSFSLLELLMEVFDSILASYLYDFDLQYLYPNYHMSPQYLHVFTLFLYVPWYCHLSSSLMGLCLHNLFFYSINLIIWPPQ